MFNMLSPFFYILFCIYYPLIERYYSGNYITLTPHHNLWKHRSIIRAECLRPRDDSMSSIRPRSARVKGQAGSRDQKAETMVAFHQRDNKEVSIPSHGTRKIIQVVSA